MLLTEKPVIETECMDISINTNTVSVNSVYYDGMTEEKLSIIKALKATGGHRKKTAELLLYFEIKYDDAAKRLSPIIHKSQDVSGRNLVNFKL